MAENVAQTTGENVDRPKMWDCLERAGIADKIRELPQKENAHLGREVYLDGIDLSGGQLQRLMLARALYKDAPVVVLDEPTAALDPIAERDLLLLIENGGIAEEGTHEELLAAGGRYAYLFDIQSKYYKEGAMEDE